MHRRAFPVLVVLLTAGDAAAFCRTSTATTATFDGHVCSPSQEDDKGLPLFWPQPRVTYALQKDASTFVSLDVARDLVRRAFQAWTEADCGGARPRIELLELEPVPCALHEFNQKRGNANILVFRDESWPHDASQVAVTTVTFGTDDGEIFDADMELNSALGRFTTTDVEADADIDLLSVFTHETGHFLGLAHAPDPQATMFFATSTTDLLEKRTLTGDDRAGICAIYPPGPIAEGCLATPRHGSSPLCEVDQIGPAPDAPSASAERCCCPDGQVCDKGGCADAGSGCACASATGASASWWGAIGLAMASALARARRAARPAQRAMNESL